jgi:hypothetical protein
MAVTAKMASVNRPERKRPNGAVLASGWTVVQWKPVIAKIE